MRARRTCFGLLRVPRACVRVRARARQESPARTRGWDCVLGEQGLAANVEQLSMDIDEAKVPRADLAAALRR